MSRRAFEAAVALILLAEDAAGAGVVTRDPRDPGGLTKWGISQKAYPDLDVEHLSRSAAVEIYRRDYWEQVRGDELPPEIAVLAFDAAVNQGVRTAAKLLQKAARTTPDGNVGPATVLACWRNRSEVASRFFAKRIVRYSESPNFAVYGEGWVARTARALLAVNTAT